MNVASAIALSPNSTIDPFTDLYKKRSLFLTGRAIAEIYASLQKIVNFSHRHGDRGGVFFELRRSTKRFQSS